MSRDVDYIIAMQEIDKLITIINDIEHGKREEIC